MSLVRRLGGLAVLPLLLVACSSPGSSNAQGSADGGGDAGPSPDATAGDGGPAEGGSGSDGGDASGPNLGPPTLPAGYPNLDLPARTYALGMYDQRCGMAKSLPFTRFVDGVDHVAPVSIPDPNASYYGEATMLLASTATP